MIRLPVLRIGDTLKLSVTLRDSQGSLITGQAAAISAPIRDARNTQIGQLVIAESAPAGTYNLTCLDTSRWPVETLTMYIRFTDQQGISCSTETIELPMEE